MVHVYRDNIDTQCTHVPYWYTWYQASRYSSMAIPWYTWYSSMPYT